MDWKEDKIKVKVINMEDRGKDFTVGCQGLNFFIKDQEIVSVPKLVVENLKFAVKKVWKINGPAGDPASRQWTSVPRYQVIEIPDSTPTTAEKKHSEIINDILEDKASESNNKRESAHSEKGKLDAFKRTNKLKKK